MVAVGVTCEVGQQYVTPLATMVFTSLAHTVPLHTGAAAAVGSEAATANTRATRLMSNRARGRL